MTVNELQKFLSTCPQKAEVYIKIAEFEDYGKASRLITAYELSHPNEKVGPTVLLVSKSLT